MRGLYTISPPATALEGAAPSAPGKLGGRLLAPSTAPTERRPPMVATLKPIALVEPNGQRHAHSGPPDLRSHRLSHPAAARPDLLRRLSRPDPAARPADRQRWAAAGGAIPRRGARAVGLRPRRVPDPADALLAGLLGSNPAHRGLDRLRALDRRAARRD